MMNSELLQYIRDQVAAGTSAEEIKQALLRAGWVEADVDAALKEIVGSVPISPDRAKEKDALSSYAEAKKKLHRRRLLIAALVVVAVVGVLVAGYFFFYRG